MKHPKSSLHILRLGDWKAIQVCSPSLDDFVKLYSERFPVFLPVSTNPDIVEFVLTLVEPLDLISQDNFVYPFRKKQSTWENYYSNFADSYQKFLVSRLLDNEPLIDATENFSFSWPRNWYNHLTNLSKNYDLDEKQKFFGLVIKKTDEQSWIQLFLTTLFLANLWHIEHGGICLHSSSVVRQEKDGFLFLGKSGAGKSTTVELSASVGNFGLGDDLNFIINDAKHDYKLAPCPGIKNPTIARSGSQPFLRGIFDLVQDDSDYLEPLSGSETAGALWESFTQVPKVFAFSNDVFRMAYMNIGDIARNIPGFKLHFRKSPDFWKLIDEQFPD